MSVDEIEQVRKHITILRAAKGLSQADLAAKLGINQAQISRLENGDKTDISLSTLVQICQALDILVEDIIDPAVFTKHLSAILTEKEPESGVKIKEADPRKYAQSDPAAQRTSSYSIPERIPGVKSLEEAGEQNLLPIGLGANESLVAMEPRDLNRHMMIIGQTGTGKTEWMKNLIVATIRNDYPVIVLDTRGDISDDILNQVSGDPDFRSEDIAYLDFSDTDRLVSINPLDTEPNKDSIVAIMSMFANQMNLGVGGAPRAVLMLRQALQALMEANRQIQSGGDKFILEDVAKFFESPDFRYTITKASGNSQIQEMYDEETGKFEMMSSKQQAEMSAPIVRATKRLLDSKQLKNLFSSSENRIDWDALFNKKVVLLKLSKFGIHDDYLVPEALGTLLLETCVPAFLKSGRRGARLFIDDAPRVIGPDSNILNLLESASAKDLGITMNAQFIDQFDQAAADKILSIRTKAVFRNLPLDDKINQNVFGGYKYIPKEVTELKNFWLFISLAGHDPFVVQAPRMLQSRLPDNASRRRRQDILWTSREEFYNF